MPAHFLASAVCLFLMRVPKRPVPAGEDLRLEAARPEAKKFAGAVQELTESLYQNASPGFGDHSCCCFYFGRAGAVILNGLTGIVTHYYGLKIEWLREFHGRHRVGNGAGRGERERGETGIAEGNRDRMGDGGAWGFFLLLFSLVSHWQTGLVFLTRRGFFGAVLLVTLETLLQRIVPNYMRGRVMGARCDHGHGGAGRLHDSAGPLARRGSTFIRVILLVLAMVVVVVAGLAGVLLPAAACAAWRTCDSATFHARVSGGVAPL